MSCRGCGELIPRDYEGDYCPDCMGEEWPEEEELGWCGSFGEQLYEEGTETCDFCPLSKPCFELYKDWLKDTRGGTNPPTVEGVE